MTKFSHPKFGFPSHRFGASLSKPPLKPPFDFKSSLIKSQQANRSLTNNFLKQAALSRQHAKFSAALPKLFPRFSGALQHGGAKYAPRFQQNKLFRGVDIAMRAQNRLIKHQDHVNRMLSGTSRAISKPSFKTAYGHAAKPLRDLNRGLAEANRLTNALQRSIRHNHADLASRRKRLLTDRLRAPKPISVSRFRNDANMHRSQARLLDRIGGALKRVLGKSPKSPTHRPTWKKAARKSVHKDPARRGPGGRLEPSRVTKLAVSVGRPSTVKQDVRPSPRLAQDSVERQRPDERNRPSETTNSAREGQRDAVRDILRANATTRAADQMLSNRFVTYGHIVRSDLRDIATSMGARSQGTDGQWGITIERTSRRASTFHPLDSRDTIMPVLAELADHSRERGDVMDIGSLFRNDRGLHRQLRAVDLRRYAGFRCHEDNPDQVIRAFEQLLRDLPPGDYAIGLPRLSSLRALGAERDALTSEYRRDFTEQYNTPSGPEPTQGRREQSERLIPADAPRVPASRVRDKIEQIQDPSLRRRVNDAYSRASSRGVHITGLFADKSGHIHLSMPVETRM